MLAGSAMVSVPALANGWSDLQIRVLGSLTPIQIAHGGLLDSLQAQLRCWQKQWYARSPESPVVSVQERALPPLAEAVVRPLGDDRHRARFLEFYREFHVRSGFSGDTPIVSMAEARSAQGQTARWSSFGIEELASGLAKQHKRKVDTAMVRSIANQLADRRKEIEIRRAVELIGDAIATASDRELVSHRAMNALVELENFWTLGLPSKGPEITDVARWLELVGFQSDDIAEQMQREGRSANVISRLFGQVRNLVERRIPTRHYPGSGSVDAVTAHQNDRHFVVFEKLRKLLKENGQGPMKSWVRPPARVDGTEIESAVLFIRGGFDSEVNVVDQDAAKIYVQHANLDGAIEVGFRQLAQFANTGDLRALDEGYWILMNHTPWTRGT
ncbi:MAG: hypothetical protein AAB425_05175, partial [Bdellovibrionota bacterium]